MQSKRTERKTGLLVRSSFLFLLLLSLVISACSNPGRKVLDHISDFPVPDGNNADALTAGPDGNVWFTEDQVNKIGRITPAGKITEFTIFGDAYGITAGPDGNVWFTEVDNIGKITPTGQITEFRIFRGANSITAGPDGNLWFTEDELDMIGRITPTGKITEFSLPLTKSQSGPPNGQSGPMSITAGPDGNLWFIEHDAHMIGRITPTGKITAFQISSTGVDLGTMTSGPDGNLWFTDSGSDGSAIVRMTPGGTITEFAKPSDYYFGTGGITAGPDGNLWFIESLAGAPGKIGRVSPHQ